MTVRSGIRSGVRSGLRSPFIGRRITDPLPALIDTLFGNGEQGLIWLPKPQVLGRQALWQQSDGTVIVDADGDPIGRGEEFSGNDNDLTQPTSADRPLYRTDGTLHWAQFDGAGDFIYLNAPTETDGYFVAAVQHIQEAEWVILGSDVSNNNYGMISKPGDTAQLTSTGGAARADGAVVTSRDALYQIISTPGWHIVELESADLTGITDGNLVLGRRGAGGMAESRIGDSVLVYGASAEAKASARDYIANKYGVAL